MKFKGTGEDWVLRTFPDGQMSVRTVSDSRKICVSRVQNHEESLANLTLISASKDLLKALEFAVCQLKEHAEQKFSVRHAISEGEKAIHKALNVE
jgi:glycine cleavage system regulatory protein